MSDATCFTILGLFLFKDNNVICTRCCDLQKVIFVIHYLYVKNLLIKCQGLIDIFYSESDMSEAIGFGFLHEDFFLLCLVVFRFTLSLRCDVTAFFTVLLPNL